MTGADREPTGAVDRLLDDVADLEGHIARRFATLDGEGAEAVDLRKVARRLANSVIRPLASRPLDVPAPAHEPPTDPDPIGPDVGEHLWNLARQATTLLSRSGGPAGLHEAAAALQDLTTAVLPGAAPASGPERVSQLREIVAARRCSIRSMRDGPYLVTNVDQVTDGLGQVIPALPLMALCRCGRSSTKPLCDGTHAAVMFTDGKDPTRVADRRDSYVGQQVTILDNRGTCQHSGLCTDRLASVFHLAEEPFVTPSGGRMDEIIRAVRDCPSGALSYALDGHEARDQVDHHHERPAAIEITRDGPYRVTGSIALIDDSGRPEPVNQGSSSEHYALCRCGQSRNKPFCTGMHWYVEFHDPVPDAQHEPTIFEWCGGLPALTRMTRLFYEKYVPNDPLLAPLFAEMSADHPERVASWLGEVFGGPRSYSEAYGGYPRMVSQHVGKELTEEKRARWVALILQSAHDAGLPNDAEFRSAFSSYIEWGSRLAVENSQPGCRPPAGMPMPRWDWTTAAGPPGSRISALASGEGEPEPAAIVPAGGGPVSFEAHVKPLFRPQDQRSMRFTLDLWAYDDVARLAEEILARLRDGTMPCDGAWSTDKVEVFTRWIQSGKSR